MQTTGGGSSGSGNASGAGCLSRPGALDRTPLIFGGQPGSDCGAGGGGSGSGALSGAPTVFGREEAVADSAEAEASARGSDQGGNPGWPRGISGCTMDVTDSL